MSDILSKLPIETVRALANLPENEFRLALNALEASYSTPLWFWSES